MMFGAGGLANIGIGAIGAGVGLAVLGVGTGIIAHEISQAAPRAEKEIKKVRAR